MQTEDVYEERMARFLELAEAAQIAAERAPANVLKITYARLASQWVELAQMAARMISMGREMRALRDDSAEPNVHDHRIH
ncbi:MAG TPA: hypothetical protein VMF67_12645 [Rhizomicrobium sp.]|nr:hypothetical protein [Rhizomicrobium sp.]